MVRMILISVFASLTVFFFLQLLIPVSDKEIIKGRFKKIFRSGSMEEIEDEVIRERYQRAQKKKNSGSRLVSRELEDYVAASGVRLTAREFLNLWIGAAFIPMILFAVLGLSIISVFAIGIVGFSVPLLFLQHARKKRQEKFTKQLGEALVIIGNAVKGGFSFRQALESVAADMQPPISLEFGRAIREIHFGVSQEEALVHLTERMKNRDLDLLVSAVLTSAQVGGNLSEILEIIASTIKDRIRIKQEVHVLTASGRLSAMIIGALPIFLFLVIMLLNPTYVTFFIHTGMGRIMLIVSVLLEFIGFLAIRKIADIEY